MKPPSKKERAAAHARRIRAEAFARSIGYKPTATPATLSKSARSNALKSLR